MDEENMVHIYNGILHRITKEWNHAICSKIDGPRDCHIAVKTVKTKDQTSVIPF